VRSSIIYIALNGALAVPVAHVCLWSWGLGLVSCSPILDRDQPLSWFARLVAFNSLMYAFAAVTCGLSWLRFNSLIYAFVVAVQSPYHSCDLDCKIYIYSAWRRYASLLDASAPRIGPEFL